MSTSAAQGMAEQLLLTLLGFSLTPFLLLIGLIVVPGQFGISFGIRKFYIDLLLRLFKVCMDDAIILPTLTLFTLENLRNRMMIEL